MNHQIGYRELLPRCGVLWCLQGRRVTLLSVSDYWAKKKIVSDTQTSDLYQTLARPRLGCIQIVDMVNLANLC